MRPTSRRNPRTMSTPSGADRRMDRPGVLQMRRWRRHPSPASRRVTSPAYGPRAGPPSGNQRDSAGTADLGLRRHVRPSVRIGSRRPMRSARCRLGRRDLRLVRRGSRRLHVSSASARLPRTGDMEKDLASTWASWTSAGPAIRAAGQMPQRSEGTVAQLSVSGRWLAEVAPIDAADVTWSGMNGDRQATRVHHRAALAGPVHLEHRGDRATPTAPAIRSNRAEPARTSPPVDCRGPKSAPEYVCESARCCARSAPTRCRARRTSDGSSTATST